MSKKPVRVREAAHRKAEAAVDYYSRDAGLAVALGFIDALQATYRFISDHPGAGSPRYAIELAIPGLRSRGLKRFPYLVFYVEHDDYIDVWHLLHAHSDVPAWMREPEG